MADLGINNQMLILNDSVITPSQQHNPAQDAGAQQPQEARAEYIDSSEVNSFAESAYAEASEYIQSGRAVKGPAAAYEAVQNYEKNSELEALMGFSLYV